ncbi:MAG: amino acid transporter, partial [Planctomycetia bacterium]
PQKDSWMDDPAHQQSHSHKHETFWLWAMCLTGVDYFSTLGYQPSIAFEAAGLLSPLATMVVVLVTLFGAFPVYSFVAGKSFRGLGSIGMLEKLLHGWVGKAIVITLLGFAATDFVITKTLSAADAAEHVVSNPFWPWHDSMGGHDSQRLYLTIGFLIVLGAMFLRGFSEVIGVAVVIVAVYLVLNLIIITTCLSYLVAHPSYFKDWVLTLEKGKEFWHLTEAPNVNTPGMLGIVVLSLLLFPKLALGLSGFETGVAIMGLIRGDETDTPENPAGRIRNTRKLLLTAGLIMSFCLIGSSISVSTLIPPEMLLHEEGKPSPSAKDRALAYLAHGESPNIKAFPFGDVFGTIYDISTVSILWFAGASAMAALINLVPQYLPRYGMAPEWSRAIRPMVVIFTFVNLFVTWFFKADVSAQGGAYATGVLVLILSACVAASIEKYRSRKGNILFRIPWYFLLVTVSFAYTACAVIIEKPEGIKISAFFIGAIFISSFVSRLMRSTELRFIGFEFKDDHSRFFWETLEHLEFPILVPHRPGGRDLVAKEEIIRSEHRLSPDIPILFFEVERGDTSEFYQRPLLEVKQYDGRFVLKVSRCPSISHVIAATALELSKYGKPPEIHFGWSNESPLAANLSFLFFGEGNVPWMVRELIKKAQPDPEKQPRIIIG